MTQETIEKTEDPEIYEDPGSSTYREDPESSTLFEDPGHTAL